MRTISTRTLLIAASVVIVLAVIVVGGNAVIASGLIDAVNPEASSPDNPAIVAPLMLPPNYDAYIQQPTTDLVISPDGRAVAQLDGSAGDFAQSVSVYMPDLGASNSLEDTTVFFTIVSSIKYEGQGDVVVITTSKLSTAAAAEPTIFGDQTIQLRNGHTAWITTNLPRDLPNQVVFLVNDNMISVFGNLSLDQLQEIAEQVTVS